MQPSRIIKVIKIIIKSIVFAGLFLASVMFFNISFELDEHETELMLTDYSHASDLETVFVGNSSGRMMDADIYSAATGERAFNMCTPSQSLAISLRNIKMACSQHPIKKVILFTTLDMTGTDNYEDVEHVYNRVVDSSYPISQRAWRIIKENAARSLQYDIAATEKSVNVWIPWVNEGHGNVANTGANLRRRIGRFMSGDRLGSGIAYDLSTVVYETAPGELTGDDIDLLEQDIQLMENLTVPSDMVAEDKMVDLARICRYCTDNGLDFTVIMPPHRSDYFTIYPSFAEYERNVSGYLQDFVSKRGHVYYNCEDDPGLRSVIHDEYFDDWEHVKRKDRGETTGYLTDLLESLPP